MAKIELRRRERTKPESTYIRDFAHNVTSQFGEDGMVAKLFELIGVKNKWCVEFGAWDGKYLSNTWDLINNKGWSAMLAEGDTTKAQALANSHAARTGEVFIENLFVGWDGENSLDAILQRTPAPVDLDFLSIDIDGNDWHVWNGLQKYRPRLVVVEFNPSCSNQLYFVQDADPLLNQGSSLLAFVELAKSKNYELVATTYANAFFVTSADFAKVIIADNSIEAMYHEYMTTEICQGFDGTIHAAGHMTLTWHGIVLDQEDFQVLPKALRRYQEPSER